MDEIILYFDGCSKGNPGQSGCGAIIKVNHIPISCTSEYLGVTTNNVAEYKGLILGLKECFKLKYLKIIVKGDSSLVIHQMTGKYKVKSPHLIPLYNEAKDIIKNMDIIFLYIPREENKEADYLANMALKQPLVS